MGSFVKLSYVNPKHVIWCWKIFLSGTRKNTAFSPTLSCLKSFWAFTVKLIFLNTNIWFLILWPTFIKSYASFQMTPHNIVFIKHLTTSIASELWEDQNIYSEKYYNCKIKHGMIKIKENKDPSFVGLGNFFVYSFVYKNYCFHINETYYTASCIKTLKTHTMYLWRTNWLNYWANMERRKMPEEWMGSIIVPISKKWNNRIVTAIEEMHFSILHKKLIKNNTEMTWKILRLDHWPKPDRVHEK